MDSTDFFEAIVSEQYEPLFKFALSLTRAESDAEDLTQQTFYTWATKGHQLRDTTKAKTWLFTTMHRAFLQMRRRQTRFPHEELDEVAAQLPVVSPALGDHVDSSLVLSALAKVDELFQPAVALFYLEDYSYNEIAGILEVPIGTVKSRLARGLAQLREILLSVSVENRTELTANSLPVPKKTMIFRKANHVQGDPAGGRCGKLQSGFQA
jgi:RNA polymerase sigma-70 factor (ECF subfamily)